MGNRILVIDDQKETLELFQEMLGQQGYSEVATAASAEQGMKEIAENRPDVILLDVLMPQMDGFVFYKSIRNNPATAKIPVIVVTARSRMEDSFRALGVDGFFAKPFNTDSLLDTLKKFANNSGSGSAVSSDQRRTHQLADAKRLAESAPLKTKRALIFGYDRNTANNMASDLIKRGYAITMIDRETDITEYTAAIVFDLVIVQLYLQDVGSLDQVVKTIREQTDSRRRKLSNYEIEDVPVVIYKVASETQAGYGDEIADIDAVLDRCTDFGRVQYIGNYSPISFLSKIKDSLKEGVQ